MSSFKKIDLYRDFAEGVYLSEAQNPYPPPPLNTVQYYARVYSKLIHPGKGGRGGRVEPERRLEGQQFTKLGRKDQRDGMYLHSTNSDKHLPQSQFF
jgi:hypothetical protein